MPLTLSSMKALRTVGDNKAAVVDYELPVPDQGQILVNVKAIGLNPTDWKHVAYITPKNCGVGCDYAGEVVYDAAGFKKGDRVGGFVHGGAYEKQGAFAEYLVTDPEVVFRVPKETSFEQAAAYPVPYITACQALYQKLKLNGPTEGKTSSENILIYGASSAVGVQAVQLAKLSGYKVIAVASKKNFELLKKLGADETFDYSDSDVVEKIKSYSSTIKYALDAISEEASYKISTNVLASGGKLAILLPPPKEPRSDIEFIGILAYTTLGKGIEYGPLKVAEEPESKAFATEAWKELTALLEAGKITTSPIKHMSGGLGGIPEGFEYMKAGKVSAQKLVYTL